MDHVSKVITEYVRRSQKENSDHSIYREYLEKMEKIPLDQLKNIHGEMIIKPFLYKWGKMGRVLAQKEFMGWEREIIQEVVSNCGRFEKFRLMHLLDSNLFDFKQEIIETYESFKSIVERVGATKVLHLICPSFFPIWDNNIEDAIRREMVLTVSEGIEEFIKKDFDLFRKNIEPFSGEDYYIFMLMAKYVIERYKETLFELSRIYGKGVIKVFDDLLWMMVHRPFSLFSPEI